MNAIKRSTRLETKNNLQVKNTRIVGQKPVRWIRRAGRSLFSKSLEKEDCVYDKMGAKPGEPMAAKGRFEGMSVTVQKRFQSDGTPYVSGSWTGTLVPDLIYSDSGGEITHVRDLKFPCPSEAKKKGQWGKGQERKYRTAFGVEPELIFPL